MSEFEELEGEAPSPDLITLEEARSFLQKAEDEKKQDGVIAETITTASTEIRNHTNREFVSAGDKDLARTFVFEGGKRLNLFPYDLREASTVRLASDLSEGSQVDLDASQWRLRPIPSRYGVYQWLELPKSVCAGIALPEDREDFEVTVTGKWGFASVPEDVKQWCKVTVAVWLRKDVSAFSTTLRLEEDKLERPDQLPSAAVRGLEKYARDKFVKAR